MRHDNSKWNANCVNIIAKKKEKNCIACRICNAVSLAKIIYIYIYIYI